MITTLYKRDSKGNTRIWLAYVIDNLITVNHGLEGGRIQEDWAYCYGKNIGKANETTPEQQAVLKCEAMYRKKVERDGYKYSLDDEDTLIAPMLSLDYTKVPHRVPDNETLFLSPKLDGVRCLWIPGKGLQSRKGKFYKIPHIEALLKDTNVILDGELWLESYPLNEIVSAVKKPNMLTPKLQFHIFDVVSEMQFTSRLFKYKNEVKRINSPFIQAVPQACRNKSEIEESHRYYLSLSYEGTMIRVPEFPYQHTRSASLFKYKDFQEAEYFVTGVSIDKEGNGVLEFEGFKARCRGTDEYRRHQVDHPNEYIGKLATIRYFALTPFGIPQFPVCIAIRDYE
jgi:DNA ligase-1